MMFDDYHTHKTHPGSTTVTAALALAERMGDVSGRELVTAVAIGNDLTCRMGSSIPLDVAKSRGWLTTDVFGTFGATAACARLLRLSVDEVRHAFGIALFEAAGTREAYSGHSESGRSAMMQAMSTGFRSQGAVLAALMAQAGITGPEDTFEGATGLYPGLLRRPVPIGRSCWTGSASGSRRSRWGSSRAPARGMRSRTWTRSAG